jgi:ATP-dependent DNA ligase
VRLYAFDLLAHDGVDMRDQPLQIRKQWLGKLLKRSGEGILYNDHEAGVIGPRLFEQACKMGLEGIVSKHRRKTYRAGRCAFWIKVKPEVPCHAPRRRGRLVTRQQKITLGEMRSSGARRRLGKT